MSNLFTWEICSKVSLGYELTSGLVRAVKRQELGSSVSNQQPRSVYSKSPAKDTLLISWRLLSAADDMYKAKGSFTLWILLAVIARKLSQIVRALVGFLHTASRIRIALF